MKAELPDFLLEISRNLNTQDNRGTANPMFVVFEKEIIVTHADYDHDRIEWSREDDPSVTADSRQHARLEKLYASGRDTPNWYRVTVKEIDRFVTVCFTEKGCKDYLEINRHNLRKPFIYAAGSYRNHEYQQMRNWLMGLTKGDNK